MKNLNPIARKLNSLLATGKTTKEKICVACDIRYPTFANIFTRPTVSKPNLQMLYAKGIINQKDKDEYTEWVVANGLLDKRGKSEKRKGSKRKHSNKNQITEGEEPETRAG